MVRLSNKYLEPVKNNVNIRILCTIEYTEKGALATFNIGKNGEDYGDEYSREELEALRDKIAEVLGDIDRAAQARAERRKEPGKRE